MNYSRKFNDEEVNYDEYNRNSPNQNRKYVASKKIKFEGKQLKTFNFALVCKVYGGLLWLKYRKTLKYDTGVLASHSLYIFKGKHTPTKEHQRQINYLST